MKPNLRSSIDVISPLLILALVAATILFQRHAVAQRIEMQQQDVTDVSALRAEIRVLHRQIREAEREDERSISPKTALALNRLGDMMELMDNKSMVRPYTAVGGSIIPFFGQSQDAINPAMAALFDLTEEEMNKLNNAFQSARAEIRRLTKLEGQTRKAGIVPSPAMLVEHEKMRNVFKQTMGAERFSYYEAFGCDAEDLRILFNIKIQ